MSVFDQTEPPVIEPAEEKPYTDKTPAATDGPSTRGGARSA